MNYIFSLRSDKKLNAKFSLYSADIQSKNSIHIMHGKLFCHEFVV